MKTGYGGAAQIINLLWQVDAPHGHQITGAGLRWSLERQHALVPGLAGEPVRGQASIAGLFCRSSHGRAVDA
jgi:hypothetical protein